jgi:hypothetical protein
VGNKGKESTGNWMLITRWISTPITTPRGKKNELFDGA